jgi:uncharacterized protein
MHQEIKAGTPYRQALVSFDAYANDFSPADEHNIDRPSLIASLKSYAGLHGFQVDWDSVEQAPTETVINVAAQICPFDSAAKQALLETVTLPERARALVALLEWDVASDDTQPPGTLQ